MHHPERLETLGWGLEIGAVYLAQHVLHLSMLLQQAIWPRCTWMSSIKVTDERWLVWRMQRVLLLYYYHVTPAWHRHTTAAQPTGKPPM